MPADPTSIDETRAVPPAGSRYLDPATLEWQPDGPRFWTKLLHEDLAKGERTLLMKVDPGASFPLHAMIDPGDLRLFQFVDEPEEAWQSLLAHGLVIGARNPERAQRPPTP